MRDTNPIKAGAIAVAVVPLFLLLLLFLWGESTQPPKDTNVLDSAEMTKCLQNPNYAPACREWLNERAEQEKDAEETKCLKNPNSMPTCHQVLQERAEREKDAAERLGRTEQEKDAEGRLERSKAIAELTRQEKETRAACPGFLDAPIGFKRCVEADEIREQIKELKAAP